MALSRVFDPSNVETQVLDFDGLDGAVKCNTAPAMSDPSLQLSQQPSIYRWPSMVISIAWLGVVLGILVTLVLEYMCRIEGS